MEKLYSKEEIIKTGERREKGEGKNNNNHNFTVENKLDIIMIAKVQTWGKAA